MYYNIIDLEPVPCRIHGRVIQRHPELNEEDVLYAWRHFACTAIRFPREREIRIGFDSHGRGIEMAGSMTSEGWLIYHAVTPPTQRMLVEIEKARRRK